MRSGALILSSIFIFCATVVYLDEPAIAVGENGGVLYAQSVLHEIGEWGNVGDLIGPPDGHYAYTANSLEKPWAGASSSAGSAVWLDFGRVVHSGTIVVYHDDPGGHYTDLVAGPWYGFCPSVPYPVPHATDVACFQGNIQGSGMVTCYTTPLDFRYVRLDHFTLDSSLQDGIDAVAVIEGVPSGVGIDLVPPPVLGGPAIYAAGQSNNGYWNNPGELLGSPDGLYAWSGNPGHTMPHLVVDLGRTVYSGTIVIHHDKTDLLKSSLGVSINSQEYDPDPDTCPAWPGTDGWEMLWTGHAEGVTTLQFPPTSFRYIQFGQSHCGGQQDGIDAVEVYESPRNVAPKASFNINPVVAQCNEIITLDASASSDSDGFIVEYGWDFDSDGEIDEINTAPFTTHSYPETGVFTVTLTVEDNSGATDTFAADGEPVFVAREVRDVVVVLAKFSESPTEGMPVHLGEDLSQFEKDLALNINKYYVSNNSSMGAVAFDFTFKDDDGQWYEVPESYNYYSTWESETGNANVFIEDAVRVADTDIQFDMYDGVVVVSPGTLRIAQKGSYYYWWPFQTDDGPIYAIYIWEELTYGVWCHELGHSIGMFDLYAPPGDWFYNSRGDVGLWCLMGEGVAPDPLCCYSRLSQSWLVSSWIPMVILEPIETSVVDLARLEFGSEVPVYWDVLTWPTTYIFEARTEEMTPLMTKGVAIYKNEIRTLVPLPGFQNVDFLEPQIPAGLTRNIAIPTLAPARDAHTYIDVWEFLQFTYLESAGDVFQPGVRISRPSLGNLVGAGIEQNLDGLVDSALFQGIGSSIVQTVVFPDLDLHAYDAVGNHVGVSYSTGEYEVEIPGALAAGDQTYAKEWIFVPLGTNVHFVVTADDVQEFINANPDVTDPEAIVSYTSEMMLYGNNPRVTEVDGDWIVVDRYTSDPVVHDMEPSEDSIIRLPAEIDFDPDTLNLKRKGRWVTVYIELPEEFNVNEIDISTVRLNADLAAENNPKYGFVGHPEIYDRDGDGLSELMVKFDWALLQQMLEPGTIEMVVTGKVVGIDFEGRDPVRVIGGKD